MNCAEWLTHVCTSQCSPDEVCVLSLCPLAGTLWQRVHKMYRMFCCLSHKPIQQQEERTQFNEVHQLREISVGSGRQSVPT